MRNPLYRLIPGVLCLAGALLAGAPCARGAASPTGTAAAATSAAESLSGDEEESPGIPDPLEPVNRVFFTCNDALYVWVMLPVTKCYTNAVPVQARVCIRNFFTNLVSPVRVVNSALQGKFRGAGREVSRFCINTTVGIGGLLDPATSCCKLRPCTEDLGQTLGSYGLRPMLYLNWPLLGPSSLRDSLGRAGDYWLNPMAYASTGLRASSRGVDLINDSSFSLEHYDKLKAGALDPYIAMRDAYCQYRQHLVEE